MDAIDAQIIALMRENSRRSVQDIGAQVALSAPAVKRRVDRLEAAGVLKGYTAVIDPAAMGWGTHAFVALYGGGRLAAGEVRGAGDPHAEGAAAYPVAGEASAILHVRAELPAHLEDALE